MDTGDSRITKLFLLAVVAGALIAGFIIFNTLRGRGKVAIEVFSAPKQVTIAIDNKRVGSTFSLAPGNYTLKVSREGFSTYQDKFEVKAGDSKKTFPVALQAQSAAAKTIAQQQAKRYAEVEGLGGQKAQEASDQFIKSNPLVGNLPYKTSYYRIDYGKDAAGQFVVQVTANTPVGRQVALEKIRSWGFDPTDYIIQFIGLSNPFGDAKRSGG